MSTETIIYKTSFTGYNNLTTLIIISINNATIYNDIYPLGSIIYTYKYQKVMYPSKNDTMPTTKRSSRTYLFTSTRNDLTEKEMFDEFTKVKTDESQVKTK